MAALLQGDDLWSPYFFISYVRDNKLPKLKYLKFFFVPLEPILTNFSRPYLFPCIVLLTVGSIDLF